MSHQYDHAHHRGDGKNRQNEKMKRRIEADVMSQILPRLNHGVLLELLPIAGRAENRTRRAMAV